jgi:hypothetical protein
MTGISLITYKIFKENIQKIKFMIWLSFYFMSKSNTYNWNVESALEETMVLGNSLNLCACARVHTGVRACLGAHASAHADKTTVAPIDSSPAYRFPLLLTPTCRLLRSCFLHPDQINQRLDSMLSPCQEWKSEVSLIEAYWLSNI